jgi:hypothetical protein
MDEVERLEEQRVEAARAVKKLSLIRERAYSNVFELKGMETNPERREQLLELSDVVEELLNLELREAQEWLSDTESDLEIAREQREVNCLRERRGK